MLPQQGTLAKKSIDHTDTVHDQYSCHFGLAIMLRPSRENLTELPKELIVRNLNL